jgi:hypothetical protein
MRVCACTELVEAAVAQLLSAEPQFFQVHTLKAQRTQVSLPVWRTVGVGDGQAVPCHSTDKHKKYLFHFRAYLCLPSALIIETDLEKDIGTETSTLTNLNYILNKNLNATISKILLSYSS